MRTVTTEYIGGFCRIVAMLTMTGCLPPSPPCWQASACGENGECAEMGGRCAAVSESDCRKSQKCENIAACHLCGKGTDCVCAIAGDTCCAPKTAAECKASYGCMAHGLCSFYSGVCVAETDDDCAKSRDCQDRGFCQPSGSLGCLAGGLVKDVRDTQWTLTDPIEGPGDVSPTE